jgi:hypothetical protein
MSSYVESAGRQQVASIRQHTSYTRQKADRRQWAADSSKQRAKDRASSGREQTRTHTKAYTHTHTYTHTHIHIP